MGPHVDNYDVFLVQGVTVVVVCYVDIVEFVRGVLDIEFKERL